MNIRRFQAATSREALAKARLAFGDHALILSNQKTATGVEVVATSEDSLQAIQKSPAALNSPATMSNSRLRNKIREREMMEGLAEQTSVQQDAQQLAMSTLSFQDYVRERMLKKRQQELLGQHAQNTTPDKNNRQASSGVIAHRIDRPEARSTRPSEPERKPTPAIVTKDTSNHKDNPGRNAPQHIVDELKSMKDLIEERFSTLAWLDQARQSPLQANLVTKLIRAGYSPGLARAVLQKLPNQATPASAVKWVMDTLSKNLKTDIDQPSIPSQGGIFALVGATGVGKTTTIAKLAGHCVKQYGSSSVGLITLDTFKIGAQEQLRAFGKMMGIVAHLVHDKTALADMLGLLQNKKLVLIDTTGLAPRDPRAKELMQTLNMPEIQRLLVLNAGSHGDTLDQTLNSFKGQGLDGGILSKIDEAAKLGPALDASIRHQLVLRGVTNGQRVPEDWGRADSTKLVRLSMRSMGKSAYDPTSADLGFFFATPDAVAMRSRGGHA